MSQFFYCCWAYATIHKFLIKMFCNQTLVKIWFQIFLIQLLYSEDLILYYISDSYKCYQLILIIEFGPKMKYSYFDLLFFSKINQGILVAILFFLILFSVTNDHLCDILLSLISFWSDYLSSRWILFAKKPNYNLVNWN